MKPHQTARLHWSILVPHISAGSTAAGLLCFATFSSRLHIFTPSSRRVLSKPWVVQALFPCSNLLGWGSCGAVGIFATITEAEWHRITCGFGTGLNSRDFSRVQKSNTASGTLAFVHTWEIGRQKSSLIHGILPTKHICYLKHDI